MEIIEVQRAEADGGLRLVNLVRGIKIDIKKEEVLKAFLNQYELPLLEEGSYSFKFDTFDLQETRPWRYVEIVVSIDNSSFLYCFRRVAVLDLRTRRPGKPRKTATTRLEKRR